MTSYLVSFELDNALADNSGLVNALESYQAKAVFNETVWVLITQHSAIEVREHLKQFLQSQDRIFIIKSGVEAAWLNPACSNEWLRENL